MSAIYIPVRAEGERGLIGDGVQKLNPGEAGYAEWKVWLEKVSALRRKYPELESDQEPADVKVEQAE